MFGLGIVNLGVILDGGDYRVRGVETSGVARVTTGLTIEAGIAWNHSELGRQANLLWRDATPIDFSVLRDSQSNPVANPSGSLGNPLAGAPPLQGNNLTDTRAQLYANYTQYKAVTVNRPRTIGLRVSFAFDRK